MWMSGLLVGTDPTAPGRCRNSQCTIAEAPVYVIVEATSSPRTYALAITRSGRTAIQMDGVRAALAGLAIVFAKGQRKDR